MVGTLHWWGVLNFSLLRDVCTTGKGMANVQVGWTPNFRQQLQSKAGGRSWNNISLVGNKTFFWAADGVYRQVAFVTCPHAPLADTHYLTCRIQECSETKRSGPFSRSIDVSSLVVQDEYIFIQVRWLPASGTWILPAQGIFYLGVFLG